MAEYVNLGGACSRRAQLSEASLELQGAPGRQMCLHSALDATIGDLGLYLQQQGRTHAWLGMWYVKLGASVPE